MLCGYLPFEDKNTKELYKKILNTEFKLPSSLTDSAKSMLKGLLTKDPESRITIE